MSDEATAKASQFIRDWRAKLATLQDVGMGVDSVEFQACLHGALDNIDKLICHAAACHLANEVENRVIKGR